MVVIESLVAVAVAVVVVANLKKVVAVVVVPKIKTNLIIKRLMGVVIRRISIKPLLSNKKDKKSKEELSRVVDSEEQNILFV